MNSTERTRAAILGKPYDRQPIYGWVAGNLGEEITERWGSPAAFEDKYEFDIAHLFGGPYCFREDIINTAAPIRTNELTPDLLLDLPIFSSPDNLPDYDGFRAGLAHHKQRDRFCYAQTPGFFENFNGIFGIENHLMWLAMYPDELNELYRRMAEWTVRFTDHVIDLGADMIHISDDWGAQKDLLMSPSSWREMIAPGEQKEYDLIHEAGLDVWVHSCGDVRKIMPDLADMGVDVLNPIQPECMDIYKLKEQFGHKMSFWGGISTQRTLPYGTPAEVADETRRIAAYMGQNGGFITAPSQEIQADVPFENLCALIDTASEL